LTKVPDDEATNDEESFFRTPASTNESSKAPVRLSVSEERKLTKKQSTLAGIGAGGNFSAINCKIVLRFHSAYLVGVWTPYLLSRGRAFPTALPLIQISINSISSQILY
jgi:hypothetical protein